MISGKKVLNLAPHQLLACNNLSVMVIVVHDTYKTCLEKYLTHQFSSVQFSRSVVYNSLRSHAHQASLSITNSKSSPKLMSINSVKSSSHLIFCCPLLLLPSILPSIKVLSNESILRMSWPKYWSFSLSISRSNEHAGLISSRMDWLDLLAVQGTLMSLLNITVQKDQFFSTQLSL